MPLFGLNNLLPLTGTKQFGLQAFRVRAEKSYHGRPFVMQYFFSSKVGPIHNRQKNTILWYSIRSIFITDLFELQFDTATLIIPRFRMTQARGANSGSNLIYYVITWYLIPGRIYMQHYYTEI